MRKIEVKNLLIQRISTYLWIVRMTAKINFAYRFNITFQLLAVLFQIYLLKAIWTAVYTGRSSINSINLPFLISYITLANIQAWIFTPRITDILQQRIRSGEVALDIINPVNFLGQLVAQQLGFTVGLIPFVLIAFPLALVVGGMQLPVSISAIVFYILSLILAYLIVSLMGVLMGLISFWTLEVDGIQMIYRFINQLFSGTFIPLWLFPPFLRILANFLPFQAITFLSVSIYLGKLQNTEILGAFAIQLLWIIILYLLVRLIWYKVQWHIMLQGG